MAMGREGEVQSDLVMTWAEMPRSPGHAFSDRLQNLLAEAGFDAFVETTCRPYFADLFAALEHLDRGPFGKIIDVRA